MKSAVLTCWLLLLGVGLFSLDSAGAQPSKANQALSLLNIREDLRRAWYVIAEEIRNPTVSSAQGRCENHTTFLKILSAIADREYAPPQADRIFQERYRYLIDSCSDIPQAIEVAENAYGNYYIRTQRAGRAIPHIKKAIAISPPGSFNRLVNQADLSACYGDMGKFDLRDHYLSLAIQTGRTYFKARPIHLTETYFNQVKTYCALLTAGLENLSWAPDAQNRMTEMHRLWKDLERLTQRWYRISYQYTNYIQPIQSFAIAGNTTFARQLLDEIRALNRRYPYQNQPLAELEFKATEARILEAQGDHRAAASMLDEWARQRPLLSEKTLSGNDYRIVGLAHEASGDDSQAISYLSKSLAEFERLRSSFALRSRGQVLSGMTITTYWGLLRCAARQYLQTRNPIDFAYALKIGRMLRARQFGELLGIDDRLNANFDFTRLALKPKELLVNIVVTDQAIVIFEIALDHRDLKIIPIQSDTFGKLLRKTKSSLLDFSPTSNLIENLLQISAMIVAPLIETLSGYDRILTIPDGMLNGIPFTILSKSPDHYLPLILTHEIVLTPSLSYLIRQRTRPYHRPSEKLLALADPIFGKPLTPPAYQDQTRGFYTRAVETFGLFEPLPETRQEVANIVSLFNPGETKTLIGPMATKAHLLAQNLNQYRYLHFATHGVLGNQIPGIEEPAIILSNGQGQSFGEGFLTLSEVQRIPLNSELTVLSACDTGSGKYFTGEGVMGLSRGFLLAGSQSVLVSLWPVASDTTVALMTDFYRFLKAGHSKATSLRLAQLAMLRDPLLFHNEIRGIHLMPSTQPDQELVHPFFWAPFVLIGE